MPKVTHPVSDDDDNVFGSAEDYDDSDMIFTKPTRTSPDSHHYSFTNGGGGGGGAVNNNGRYNVPLFGNHAGSIGASGNSVNGINGKNAIVSRTDVRDIDNEVTSSATTTQIPSPAIWLNICNRMPLLSIIPTIYFNYLTIFVVNLLSLIFSHCSVT